MFRAMIRSRQTLSREACIAVLKQEPRGVLSLLGDGGYPYGVPLDHCGKRGHKIDAIRHCDKASFCVMDQGFRREGEWARNISSVIVFGRISILEDQQEAIRITRALSYKYTQDSAFIEREIEQSGANVLVFALTPEHISGKHVVEE